MRPVTIVICTPARARATGRARAAMTRSAPTSVPSRSSATRWTRVEETIETACSPTGPPAPSPEAAAGGHAWQLADPRRRLARRGRDQRHLDDRDRPADHDPARAGRPARPALARRLGRSARGSRSATAWCGRSSARAIPARAARTATCARCSAAHARPVPRVPVRLADDLLAPLIQASGYIGFANYAGYLVPQLAASRRSRLKALAVGVGSSRCSRCIAGSPGAGIGIGLASRRSSRCCA